MSQRTSPPMSTDPLGSARASLRAPHFTDAFQSVRARAYKKWLTLTIGAMESELRKTDCVKTLARSELLGIAGNGEGGRAWQAYFLACLGAGAQRAVERVDPLFEEMARREQREEDTLGGDGRARGGAGAGAGGISVLDLRGPVDGAFFERIAQALQGL